jgi:hypothetical protein
MARAKLYEETEREPKSGLLTAPSFNQHPPANHQAKSDYKSSNTRYETLTLLGSRFDIAAVPVARLSAKGIA